MKLTNFNLCEFKNTRSADSVLLIGFAPSQIISSGLRSSSNVCIKNVPITWLRFFLCFSIGQRVQVQLIVGKTRVTGQTKFYSFVHGYVFEYQRKQIYFADLLILKNTNSSTSHCETPDKPTIWMLWTVRGKKNSNDSSTKSQSTKPL